MSKKPLNISEDSGCTNAYENSSLINRNVAVGVWAYFQIPEKLNVADKDRVNGKRFRTKHRV